MKHLKKLYSSIFLIFSFAALSCIYADGPGTTMFFDPAPMDGIGGAQSSAWDSYNNQFFFTWLSGVSQIDYVICSSIGAQVAPQGTIAAGSSSPSVCYNSTDRQYFVTWVEATSALMFSILDDTGTTVIGPNSITVDYIGADAMCCYNTRTNQYCITWTAGNGGPSNTYFVIINADGSVAQDITMIPAVAGQSSAADTDSFVTYNSQNNEYLFTWLSDTGLGVNETAFAIYGATGGVVVPAQIIPQPTGFNTTGHPPFSCYNSLQNQYFITWNPRDTGGELRAYFAIYSATGTALVPATQIPALLDVYQTPVCSYNVQTNQYFVTWNGTYSEALYAIFDSTGTMLSSGELPLLSGNVPVSLVFNTLSVQDSTYFVTWYAGNGCAYFNIFTSTPTVPDPVPSLVGQHGLNRFANYGEYVNQLQWTPSPSPTVTTYQIYRDATVIATVPASTTIFAAHNQPSSPTTYSVQAVNAVGQTSSLVSITL